MPEKVLDESKSEPIVVSIERTLIILNLLARSGRGMGTREISHQLGYSAGSVQKILNTLRVQEFVVKDPDTDRYGFGPAAMRLAHQILTQVDLTSIARPYLEELARRTDETIFLGVRDGASCIYIDKIISNQAIRMDAPLGVPRPLNCTAVGKALLAFDSDLSPDKLRRMAADGQLHGPTDHSITDPDALFDELARVRAQGVAVDDRESLEAVGCVAVPVINHEGAIIGAISVSGPAERIIDRKDTLTRLVREAGEALNLALGYNPGG
ncbi:MAG: IclR family transcriptional regulator [Anaerolineae bacterium]|nr:IclR family transcriptional regulator [Anaerolineae bacterium]